LSPQATERVFYTSNKFFFHTEILANSSSFSVGNARLSVRKREISGKSHKKEHLFRCFYIQIAYLFFH
ncbi:MAG: hypothetical protein IKM38_07305, partial [Christensenellaceae bacterium]|nr:hypothetical protein [Christensenellaceae bacterium]